MDNTVFNIPVLPTIFTNNNNKLRCKDYVTSGLVPVMLYLSEYYDSKKQVNVHVLR